ncbi:hypothetical protein SAMN05428975_0313 [Mucilaginibacter sp. OK268]|uniref:hypothetical protein n=1 Tax=Mucilaginibacter sp. OK268 TaxID=1881048 RepID=UPI0008843811|nr:hypothetical protein [Mucilaginibacter sp. OK268]SDP10295.1 hypothetical protein SAMN05428975_0313 [Mucilaginibacter sp. OK268]
MDTIGKTFCNTHFRHLRLLFFVDAGVSPCFLIDLLTDYPTEAQDNKLVSIGGVGSDK